MAVPTERKRHWDVTQYVCQGWEGSGKALSSCCLLTGFLQSCSESLVTGWFQENVLKVAATSGGPWWQSL